MTEVWTKCLAFSILALFLFVQCENKGPNASFQIGEELRVTTNEISFTNLSSGAVAQEWYFGDGSVSGAVNPTHRYEKPGIYTIELQVMDESRFDIAEQTIEIRNMKFSGLIIHSIDFHKPSGDFWDSSDGVLGLGFILAPLSADYYISVTVPTRVSQDDLPYGGALDYNSDFIFTGEDWLIAFVDWDGIDFPSVMAYTILNPGKVSVPNYELMSGDINITKTVNSVGDTTTSYRATVRWVFTRQ